VQRATTQEIVQTQCANQANTLEQTCAHPMIAPRQTPMG